ncbi:unnamed protein product [Closterium sp. NIES-54]
MRPSALPERHPARARFVCSCAALPARALCMRTLLPTCTRFAGPARALCPPTRCPAPPARPAPTRTRTVFCPASAPCALPCQRATRPALPTSRTLPYHRATRPALPVPRALPCLRNVPCPTSTPRALPCLRHAPFLRHAPYLASAPAPCPARASALPYPHLRPARPSAPAPCPARASALPCPHQRPARANALHRPRQRCPARCPALPCPTWLPPELPLHLPSLSCRSTLASGLSGGAAPMAELVVLVGGSRFRHSSVDWDVWWGATTKDTCESTPASSAASRHGGSGGGQHQQQRPLETLSPQQLLEWAVRWGSPGGGGFRGTRPGGVEALAPVPVTVADSSGSPVVTCGATVLLYPAAPSGLLTGLHLPLFAKNLVASSVLQDQWVTVTQHGGELVAICTDSRTGEHLPTFTRRPGSGLYTLTTESAMVAESRQVAATVKVTASCSCRLLTHQTLLWHHFLS